MKRITVWALFDSGNGCYTKTVNKNFDNIDIYPVGIDVENKNSHFINLNLADYSELFSGGISPIFEELDKLPKPDIILASPPCESWSMASAMPRGNACWQTNEITTLFGTEKADNHFSLRTKLELEEDNAKKKGAFVKYWYKTVYNRINGELCAFNTIRIIERYKPNIWIIENPQSSRLWRYYKQIHNFNGIENVAHYNSYAEQVPKKATTFYSNIELELRTTSEKADITVTVNNDGRKFLRGYNNRSNIPEMLIKEILEKCIKKFDGNIQADIIKEK